MYIKHSSLCVNEGKDFIAPPDRETRSDFESDQQSASKTEHGTQNDSDVQQVGELLMKAASYAAHTHDSRATPSSSITQGLKGKQPLQRD